MKRTLFYFLKLALLLAVVIWIANRPGTVEIEWIGYRLETSVGILFLGVVFIAMLAAYLYRLWRGLIKAPALFGQARQDNRKKRGYQALTQGMVAVAAGDAQTATLMARKAEALLADEPPLTMLLSAQSAQLQGDEEAATNYFTAMLESSETRFLGLRGLLIQAQRRGDLSLALELAKQAHAISPKTPWVLESLFELSEASGDFAIADQALKDGAKTKNLTSAEAARKRAVIKLEQALISRDDGRHDEALVLAREAYKLAPDLVPAVTLLAEMNARAGKIRAAAKTLNKAWKEQPHRELARTYMSLWPSETPVERVKRLGQMVASNPDHYESHIALAEANLRAKLWGEARRHLKLAQEDKGASRLVCRLMGQLEQEEHGNSKAAATWFEKAETALVAHNWICDSCGAIADQWQAHCGDCGRFDSLTWKRPTLVKSQGISSQSPGQQVALGTVVADETPDVKKLPVVFEQESGKKTLKAPAAEIEDAARDLGA